MDRKGIAIIIACVLFIVIWQFYVIPRHFPVREPEDGQPKEADSPIPDQQLTEAAEPAPAPESATLPEQVGTETSAEPQPVESIQPLESLDAPPEEITLENEFCAFTFTSMGGALKRIRLKKFLDNEKRELTLVEPFDDGMMPLGLELLRPEMDLRGINHSVEKTGDSVRFVVSLSNGLEVEKEMRITPGRYDFTLRLKFTNTSDGPLDFTPRLHGPGSIAREDDIQGRYLIGTVYYLKNQEHEPYTTKPGKKWQIPSEIFIDKESASTSDISLVYIGACNRFFGTVLLAEKPKWLLVRGLGTDPIVSAALLEKIAADPANPTDKEKARATSISSYIVMAPIELDPGTSSEFVFTFYTGPKQAGELAKYGPLSNLLDYGMFRAISKMMLVILRFFYSVSGNYGIAIILMTMLVKACLFPLSRKGALSQAKQQKLAPQIKELQTKYKNNKQKLHQETMKLYREEGVHPLGGCLPMLLQLPIFIGLLRLLEYSIEIRQAVFIPGWITDLSRPDTIGHFPAGIPLLGGLPINILPLIMGSVSILHQKMMPKPADPQAQQQMMMFKFMPLMFVFLLYNWPSGLLLYWTMSSSFSVLEQYLIRKSIAKT